METSTPTSITFDTPSQASTFLRTIFNLRKAFQIDKDASEAYKNLAPHFTAVLSKDKLTVQICGTGDTPLARIAAKALAQQYEQYRAAGVKVPGMEE